MTVVATTTGWSKQVGPRPGSAFTVTEVVPGSRWSSEVPLPYGRLVVTHSLAADGTEWTRVVKSYAARGPFAWVLRFLFAPGIRRSTPATFAALEAEAVRRAAA